jgi:hypothetical protein
MKPFVLLTLAFSGLAGSFIMAAPADADALSGYRWNKRVLVVTAASPQDGDAVQQRRAYRDALRGMTERDIVLVEAIGDGNEARRIRSQLSIDGRRFKAVLVGKDGHTTLTSDTPWTADELFRKVDDMPMRKEEMRRGSR